VSGVLFKGARAMFRFALSLLVGLFFLGSASAQIVTDPNAKTVNQRLREREAEIQAKVKAEVEAAKIPAVRLSETEVAKLREFAAKGQLVWYSAGRQSDGKIFACFVTSGKTLFGESSVGVFAGTFESDGSFQQTLAYLVSTKAVMQDCRKRGFDPPVRPKFGIRF
jgi:hypothetical protein